MQQVVTIVVKDVGQAFQLSATDIIVGNTGQLL